MTQELPAITEIKNKLLDEAGHLLRIQQNLCGQLQQILFLAGYVQDEFRNVEANTEAKKWVWKNNYGLEITFTRPRYLDLISHRHKPVELSRKTEEAMLLNASNQSEAKISRYISKEVKVSTNATIKETNIFNFNVSAGMRAGVEGKEVNMGATMMLNFSASFGGEFIRAWETQKGAETVRKIADTMELEPMSNYSITATIDKIDMEQVIDIDGTVDFAISIKTPKWAQNEFKNGNLNKFKSGVTIDGDDLPALVRKLVGITGDIFHTDEKEKQMLSDNRLPQFFNTLLDESNRRINTTTKLQYRDAGEAALTVTRNGTWEKKDNKWILNK